MFFGKGLSITLGTSISLPFSVQPSPSAESPSFKVPPKPLSHGLSRCCCHPCCSHFSPGPHCHTCPLSLLSWSSQSEFSKTYIKASDSSPLASHSPHSRTSGPCPSRGRSGYSAPQSHCAHPCSLHPSHTGLLVLLRHSSHPQLRSLPGMLVPCHLQSSAPMSPSQRGLPCPFCPIQPPSPNSVPYSALFFFTYTTYSIELNTVPAYLIIFCLHWSGCLEGIPPFSWLYLHTLLQTAPSSSWGRNKYLLKKKKKVN